MKYENDGTGMCANCRHVARWCVCAQVPAGGCLVFSMGSEGATGWTRPLPQALPRRTYRADSVAVEVNGEAFKNLGQMVHEVAKRIEHAVRKNTEDAIRAGLPPGEYTIPADAVKVDDGGHITADLSQAQPVRKPVPARPPWALMTIHTEHGRRCGRDALRVDASFDVFLPDHAGRLRDALRDLGERPQTGCTAPELAAPYGTPLDGDVCGPYTESGLDPYKRAFSRLQPVAPVASNGIAVKLSDAYAAGVAAAREAIAAAKYDAERDHREWSVREVEVPGWKS